MQGFVEFLSVLSVSKRMREARGDQNLLVPSRTEAVFRGGILKSDVFVLFLKKYRAVAAE
jgi:hypothetical protein